MSAHIGSVLTQSLNLSQKSIAYLANDLANVDTPGFKAQSLQWQQALGTALKQNDTAVHHVTGSVVQATGLEQPDGSSVNLTATMSALAQAQMTYALGGTGLSTQQNEVQTAANMTTP